jgi:hypothetical protein
MGIQSARVTSEVWRCPNFHPFFLALTVCPYGDGCKTVVDLDTCLIPLPSRIIIVCGIRVAETPARKSIDTHYEQPTSPLRPTARGRAEGAFFVSDFSHSSRTESRTPGVYGIGSRKPPLENPLTHTTNSLPAPFARPPEVARRGLFLSAIFRAPRKGLEERRNATPKR